MAKRGPKRVVRHVAQAAANLSTGEHGALPGLLPDRHSLCRKKVRVGEQLHWYYGEYLFTALWSLLSAKQRM